MKKIFTLKLIRDDGGILEISICSSFDNIKLPHFLD